MKIFDSLGSLDQIRGSPLGPMLREIVIRMLGHFHYDLEETAFRIWSYARVIPVTALTLSSAFTLDSVEVGFSGSR